jgi:hypothetical protein
MYFDILENFAFPQNGGRVNITSQQHSKNLNFTDIKWIRMAGPWPPRSPYLSPLNLFLPGEDVM